ncbi:prepilin-type N-terminal cleavage/methylation domain-containing protein [Candidatus Sumerlaeota bacterium]|nr:prepilin-type N-terminal cleavage/methylation domain-containing protein [Candidatus Sumerlaeota bacterium]
MKQAFTLIELLIVVAIIAILAAIAVPNFLEAQTRAKNSAARADMRSLATAIESYFVDHNKYAWCIGGGHNPQTGVPTVYYGVPSPELTTPIAYCSSIPMDRWGGDTTNFVGPNFMHVTKTYQTSFGYGWFGEEKFFNGKMEGRPTFEWCLQSMGPDRSLWKTHFQGHWEYEDILSQYDATNGTISLGNIWRVGP